MIKYIPSATKVAMLLGIVTLANACNNESRATMETASVSFTDTQLQIPKKFIIGNLPKSVVDEDGLDDKSDEISLKVPLTVIGISTAIGPSLLENVIILIGSSGNMNIPKDVKDALTGKGLYKDRIVSKDSTMDFYRVYAKSGHPKIWHYVKNDSDLIDESSSWISSCMVSPLEDEKKDLSNVKCNSKSSYNDIVFQYTTSAKYFSQPYNIESAIIGKLKEWDTSGMH